MSPGPPGWPAVLYDSRTGVLLRPYRRSDARPWSRTRRANEEWLVKWEPTPPLGTWTELNSPAAFRLIYRELRRLAQLGAAMPFAVCLRSPGEPERFVGQVTLGNITRRAFCSAYAGYWVDSRVAGRGVIPTALAMAVDHAFTAGGLHRVEVNIRPDNVASRRVVEKLGFREEAYHTRYLHIDGMWRDHVGYAMTTEDVIAEGGLLARLKAQAGSGPGSASESGSGSASALASASGSGSGSGSGEASKETSNGVATGIGLAATTPDMA